jgi:C4-dicarboxylate-specific signal transduction histidine kinase
VSKVAILARDISDRVLAERQRRELEVKSLAQSKLACLGEIATGIAHEINQPLSFIKVVYECILRDLNRDQLDLEELREDCGEALRQVGRITSIVNHLRSFGRSDTLSAGPVRLATVLENTMILMAEKIKLRNITFTSDLEHDLPAVYGNDMKLEQVFINLLQNSIDALTGIEAAEIRITIRLLGDEVEIRFADNGPGVPPEIAARIFEPFFTTKEEGQGTGLGLAIIHSIITEHQGTLRLEPVSGQGAAFVITLPVWRDEMEEIDACDTEGTMHG